MSDAPYEKECMYCKQKIRMSKQSGSWLPYNLNNGSHDCRNKGKQETLSEIKREPFTLEAVQNKLASIGIVIDLEKLMKSD